MKATRKLFIIILIFIACLGLSSCTLIVENMEIRLTGFHFEKTEIDGISGYSIAKYRDDKEVIKIPRKHLFKPVLKIDYNAFYKADAKEIIIPDSVLVIRSHAFADCKNLTNVSIPDSVREIDKNTFDECENLQFNVYENGSYLGNNDNPYVILMKTENVEGAFSIHEQTKVILSEAFLEKDKITSVAIPDGVQIIDDNTFSSCSRLSEVTFGKNVRKINEKAFYGCIELTHMEIPTTVTQIGDRAFKRCSKLTQLDIPFGITEIGNDVFSNCSALTRVNIPDSITKISSRAFADCPALSEVNFGKNLTEIGSYAFSGCKGLTRVEIPDSVTILKNGAFDGCANLSEVSVPDSIETLADTLFRGCENLSRMVLNERITKIGNETFSYCISLNSINFPESLTQIGAKAFYHCESLSDVNLPNGITSIGNSAFSGCTSFTSFNIPDNTQEFDASVIEGCSNVKEIHFGKKMKLLTFNESLYSLNTLALYYILLEKGYIEDSLSINGNLHDLCHYLFFSSFELDKISVDEQNTTFACKNNCLIRLEDKTIILTTAKNYVLPDDGSAEKALFLGPTETLYIPESILFVSQMAVAAASPETITVADNHPVYRCKGNCLIKDNTIVGSGKNYTIPSDDDVNTIVFLITSQDLFIPKNITCISPNIIMELKQEAFSIAEDNPVYETNGGCLIEKNTKKLIRAWDDSTIPNDGSVQKINRLAFYGCKAEELALPSSIKTIQTEAFWGYSSLKTIRFAGTINEWNAIDKPDYRKYTIICSDGTIFKVKNY